MFSARSRLPQVRALGGTSGTTKLTPQIARTLQRRGLAQACGTPTFGADGGGLAPVRYHVFRTPLEYTLGLELQSGVVAERLRRKREGSGGTTDVLFLLGASPPSFSPPAPAPQGVHGPEAGTPRQTRPAANRRQSTHRRTRRAGATTHRTPTSCTPRSARSSTSARRSTSRSAADRSRTTGRGRLSATRSWT